MDHNFKIDKLEVFVLKDRKALGGYAAKRAVERIKQIASEKTAVNIIFAAAPSQNEFLECLLADTTIPWDRINAFHMDEYLGLPESAPQSFGSFLNERLFSHMPFKSVNLINGHADNVESECTRYKNLLQNFPPDIVCMGIGENTHLAFNDPPVANFKDPETIKKVTLDEACRKQQVNDGCFQSLNDVPRHALTLTIPALMQAPYIFCMVPGKLKAGAIAHTLSEPVSERYPSTILRTHENAILFVDQESYTI
jgi:glucosamine-6-phosphate deaminase